ncbi:MADF domain-containing protein [Caenorhabditis elegans]|uniref:MADF domain-containing protein n=1 Tax=Caenorhabditis elegans TaxID=6239 RepID=Q564Y3_CAEEL|nr:MADF domain-containing protein [Caenorhabditis elegans]CAI79141.2 MADF domain-containing protein [Caenorhabditis elegans]|eukprot:NP_001023688.2 Uncharacterized protein CELE_C30G7.3 [Caenorhabditis elegans]
MNCRQSKKNSHIWDNVCTAGTRRNPYYVCYGTTGSTTSSLSILEFSREQITVVSPRVKCPLKQKIVEKPKKRNVYVTNWDRAAAEQPKALATWIYQPFDKRKYNNRTASDAFDAYQHRLKLKKLPETKQKVTKTTKRHVTINEAATQVIQDVCHLQPKSYQKIRISNCRNDEVKIDSFSANRVPKDDDIDDLNVNVPVEDDDDVELDDVILAQNPAFYGTIEAEKCAERVAAHLSMACENMERLQFVTEAVYPQSAAHLKKLQEIDDDVKDFNCQMRQRRVKASNPGGTVTKVAHFIIHGN